MNRKSVLLVIVCIFFLAGLIRIFIKVSEGKKRLETVKDEVAQIIKQKEDLEKEVENRQSPFYLEREARNRLNLVKPGERIVILPNRVKPDGTTEGSVSSGGAKEANKPSEPNWVKWKRLLFD